MFNTDTAFLFPGQGAQHPRMGKDFYDAFPLFKNTFDRYSDVLKLDLKQLCFEENDRLNLTEYTQIAMLSVSLSTLKMVEKYDIHPDVTLGYSLGEYGALVASGVLKDEDALLIVQQRAKIMANAVPIGTGAMAAVIGLDNHTVEDILRNKDNVWIANYNYNGQVTITGLKQSVENVIPLLKEAGARVIVIPVSGPFHSPLLKNAGEELGRVLKNFEFHPLSVPYMPNVSGMYETDNTNTKLLLEKQVYSPVMWSRSLEILRIEKYSTCIEIGTGHILTGFNKKAKLEAKSYTTDTVKEFEEMVLALKENKK